MAWTSAQNKVISNQIYMGVQEQAQTPFFANTKWSGEAEDAQQVTIVGVGAVSIGTYTPGSDITPTVGSPTATVLAIDQYKQFYVTLDDTQKLVGDTAMKLAQKSTEAIYLESDNYLLTLATKTNFPTNWYAGASDAVVEVNSANIAGVLMELGEMLDENNVPMDMRSIIVPPSIKTKILIAMQKTGLSIQPVENVLLRRPGSFQAYGFNILTSNQYAPVGGSGTDYNIFFGHPDAIAAAYVPCKVESGRVEKQFADYTKGLFRFGGKVLDEKVGGVAYLQAKAEA
jgi:hypothetical protein